MAKHTRRSKPPQPYAPPVDALLTLGHPAGPAGDGQWFTHPFADYAAMGLTPHHVPELLRMIRDPALLDARGDAFFACVHAARAVGLLGGMNAWPHLVDLARRLHRLDWDYWIDDMPSAIAAIGPETLEPAMRLARDHRETFGFRLTCLAVPERLVDRFPDCRDLVILAYTRFLDAGEYDADGVNEFVVETLLTLHAGEALPAIERAFERGYINQEWCGDLDRIRADFAKTPEQRRAEVEQAVEAYRSDPSTTASRELLMSRLDELLDPDE